MRVTFATNESGPVTVIPAEPGVSFHVTHFNVFTVAGTTCQFASGENPIGDAMGSAAMDQLSSGGGLITVAGLALTLNVGGKGVACAGSVDYETA